MTHPTSQGAVEEAMVVDMEVDMIGGEMVPPYVLDKLKENVDYYEDVQKKCMMYLLSAKKLFRKNQTLDKLESRFLLLVEKANGFIKEEVIGSHVLESKPNTDASSCPTKVVQAPSGLEIINIPSGKSCTESINDLDEELCLSSQDWLLIDNLSATRHGCNVKAADVFNSMESQSKTISFNTNRNTSEHTTPADANTFKVHLDTSIPSFNLFIDEVDVIKPDNVDVSTNKEDLNLIQNNRPIRERKVADIHKSPYFDRLTSIYGKSFKKEETELWEWLHANDQYPNRILFKWGKINCYKVDFQSMMDGEMIMTSVMDVWCCFLNALEELRAPVSPYRLFCYIETTLSTLNASDEATVEEKYLIFETNMDHVLTSNRTTLAEVDMVFFPIHRVNHYYVVCYNLKNPAIEILDNRVSERTIQYLYGHQLTILHTHFIEFMKRKNFGKYAEFQGMDAQRLKMRWQTKDNAIDCGIFAMRHMETYFGGGPRNWDSKIQVESYTQKKQISRLRLLYTYRVLTSAINSLSEMIYDEIQDPTLVPDESSYRKALEKLSQN
uniref:Ubiquitin-like protease family profile domain-containing protein n=1 Tax=Daucus carota subsp. sativus TaxID=79200 RepID=A0A166GCN9_DAUCS